MQFINPIFLFALATALLPILYHLVRRIQAKKVAFSSLMFLRMTPKEMVRKRRIQHWLLMAMRCALLALLAFAFARPFIPKDSIPFLAQREDHSVVLLIDNSYSMQYGDLFEQARAAARQKLGEAAGDDEYTVVVFADEPRQMTPLNTDMALHQNIVDNVMAVSYRPTDFYQPLRMAEEILSNAQHQSKQIVLISDLQQAGWLGAFENWKLDAGIQFEVIALGEEAPENVYVEDFSLSEKRVDGRVVSRFDARLGLEGEAERQEQPLYLEIEGQQVEQAQVPLSQLRRASFQYRAPREGVFQGNVRVQSDLLEADDTRYFTFAVEGRPNLLGLGGSERDPRSAAYYLERAYNQGEASLYTFTTARNTRATQSMLRNQDMVFVSTGAPTQGESDALRAFAEAGGSVVISFGDQANVPAFSSLLQQLNIGRTDGIIRARTEQGQDAIIGEVDMRHPVFSIFAESGSGAIFRPRFRQYARVIPDSSASVLGRYDSNDPFLIEQQIGRGKVLVYTSSLSPEWTDFTINEMYIPFLYQVARYGLQSRSDQQLFTVGDVVRLEGRPGDTWDVRAPGDRLLKVELDETGQGFFRETEVPGHYRAANGSNSFFFSVNVDPRESMLARRDVEESLAAVVPPPDDVPMTVEAAVAASVDDDERQQKFWRFVIFIMAALFMLETYIANRKQKRQ